MKLQPPPALPHQRSKGHVAKADIAEAEGKVKQYHGGGQKDIAAPWLYALHDVVKRRERTLKLLPLIWPKQIGMPSDRILRDWLDEVEQGYVKVDPKKREWVKQSLEIDEQQAIREAVLETSQTLTHFARRLREDGEAPPGGVVALKYLADAAGFLAGKRSEVSHQTNGKQPISIGSLNISAGETRRVRAPKTITSVKVLPVGDDSDPA